MGKFASDIVTQAKAWIGRKESDGSHREIIDVYNSHKPVARGCLLSYTDAWCAGFVSAVAIKCGATDIMPTEISCSKMIEQYKKIGCWIEDETRTPRVGDLCFYDWEDDGNGDNKAAPNHVGIVSKVGSKTFEVIEGNKSDAVGVRTVNINGRYVRGFAVPKYQTQEVSSIIYVVKKGDTLRKIAKLYSVTVDDIMACNVGTIKNADKIQAGDEIYIPVPIVLDTPTLNDSDTSESLETRNYYAIGKRFTDCIEAIKDLPEYEALLQVLNETGD